MGKGKAKIEIKKIESLQARNVCFTKRRKGLFKKAAELGRLFPELRIAAVVFSPAGNPYLFGDPHALLSGHDEIDSDSVSEIEKLLNGEEQVRGEEEKVGLTVKDSKSTLEEIEGVGVVEEITDGTGNDNDGYDGLDEQSFVNQFLNF